MDLSELQQRRNVWVAHNFPDEGIEESIFGACEEIGELAHHYLKNKQKIRSTGVDHRAEMLDAVGDCIVYLAGVCRHLEADLGEVVKEVWEQVEQRDWRRFPHDGRTC